MRAHTIALLSLVAACSCPADDAPRSKAPPTAPAPPSTEDVTRAEPIAAARQAVSETYCAGACAAAGGQSCDKMAATCNYDTNAQNYIAVGSYVLQCKPACAAACLPNVTGQGMCQRQCLNGPDKPADKPASTDPAPSDNSSGQGDDSGDPGGL